MKKYVIAGFLAALLSGASSVAIAQTSDGVTQPTPPAQTGTMKEGAGQTGDAMKGSAAAGTDLTLTATEGQAWVGKRVFSIDDQDIGEVASLKEGADGNVEYFRADIGGFLGMGETSVQVKLAQLQMRDEKLYLNMTQEEAKQLPKVEEN